MKLQLPLSQEYQLVQQNLLHIAIAYLVVSYNFMKIIMLFFF